MKIPIEKIIPNPEQPRVDFDEESILAMSNSIIEHGLLNPIAVFQEDGHFVLIDGERRWRAARLAGLNEIEANVLPKNGHNRDTMLELAMLGNVQRKQMNPAEEGAAYAKMIARGKSIRDVAREVGVTEVTIRNYLLISELDEEIRELYRLGQLPISYQVTLKLKSLPENIRVEVAKGFARRKTGTNRIVVVLDRLIKNSSGIERAKQKNKSQPVEDEDLDIQAFKTSKKINGEAIDKDHWNAIAQSNWLPPWEGFREGVIKACTKCALYDAADISTCRECPLPDLLGVLALTINKRIGR